MRSLLPGWAAAVGGLLAAVVLLASAPRAAEAAGDGGPVEISRRATAYVLAEAGGLGVSGTGFCIDSSGIFVTNDHVVTLKGKAPKGVVPKITVVVSPGSKAERRIPATVVRTDPNVDLAILRVANPGRLDTVDLAQPAQAGRLKETDAVLAAGFPFGAALSATARAPEATFSTGRVTSLRKAANGEVVLIQFDGSINPGNSGGPLLDAGGNVVGVVFAIIVDARQLNLAVPVNALWALLAQANVVLTPRVLTDPVAEAYTVAGLAQDGPAGRAAVPPSPAVKEAQRAARELFAAGYADKSAKGRLVLAYDLLEKAIATKGDPGGKYALLFEAREVAISVGDYHVAFGAAYELVDRFDLPTLPTLADLLNRLGPRATKPQDSIGVAALGVAVVSAEGRREEYAEARKLMPLVRSAVAATRNPTALARVRDRLARVEAAAAEFERCKEALAKLAADPKDPGANLTVGRYHCLTRGDFARGLEPLARSPEGKLQAAAATDLAKPATPDAQRAAGDLWWDQAARETASPVAAEWCRSRAGVWYRAAEPGLAGLPKTLVQDRLGTLPPPVVLRPTTRPLEVAYGPPAANAVPTRTDSVGGKDGGDFEELAPPGGVMVGVVVTVTGDNRIINRLQPVFSVDGRTVAGKRYGRNGGNDVTVVAREGYAVGGLIVRYGGLIDGLSCVFMRRVGSRLDPDDSYVSDWVGGKGGVERRLVGTGTPAIGLFGGSGDWVDRFGLVFAVTPAVPTATAPSTTPSSLPDR